MRQRQLPLLLGPVLRAAACVAALQSCASATQPVPRDWLDVPHASRIRAVRLDSVGNVTTALQPLRPKDDIRIEHNRVMRGNNPLTGAFQAIDSFDVSESRGEVVFSAKRADNFDIGLVSTDGSPVNWVPAEPVDEVGVQWAPRGNKVSFIVRAKSGDFVRSVHIPTSAQLAVDFESAKIEALGWDPGGEHFAVAYSTPNASDRVETMAFSGKERKLALPPAEHLEVEVATFAPEAVSLRPRDIEYNEKLPLVVWIDDEPFAWSDARAALIRNARVACIVTKRAGDAVWKAVDGTPWIDRSRTFVVSSGGQAILPVGGGGQAILPVGGGGQAILPVGDQDKDRRDRLSSTFVITADPSIPAGRFLRRGNVVAVAPAVVQSFAARLIADELKRTGTPNGSSR